MLLLGRRCRHDCCCCRCRSCCCCGLAPLTAASGCRWGRRLGGLLLLLLLVSGRFWGYDTLRRPRNLREGALSLR